MLTSLFNKRSHSPIHEYFIEVVSVYSNACMLYVIYIDTAICQQFMDLLWNLFSPENKVVFLHIMHKCTSSPYIRT